MKNWKKEILPIIGVLICSVLVMVTSSMIFEEGFVEDKYGRGMEYYNGKVIEVMHEDLSDDYAIDGIQVGRQDIVVVIEEGKFKGETFEIQNPISRTYNYKVEEGTTVLLGVYYRGDEPIVQIYNYNRSHVLYALMALFVLVVVAVGGIKGLKSLAALIFTLVCTLYLMIPMMLSGIDPIVSAILVATMSIITTLLLVSGWTKKTFTAIVGTIAGVLIAGCIAYFFGKWAYLSGVNMDNAESLIYIAENSALKIHGLLFAGILIASLGAIMDVAMSIASSVFEVHGHNAKLDVKALFYSGMNIGKDIIGTMTNTLILAFAGGSLSVLIMIFSAQMPYNKFINLDILGIEIIQGLAGSIGIVLAVPITALLAAIYCKKEKGL